MFALSVALLALAVIAGLFALLGVAGPAAGVAAIATGIVAVFAMIAYWRRRPAEVNRTRGATVRPTAAAANVTAPRPSM